MTTKKRIALVTIDDAHGCVFGGLIEVLKNDYDVTLFMERGWSNYKWFEYYSDLYGECTFVGNTFKDDVKNYYKIIKLNSGDNILCKEDTVSILHFKPDISRNNNSRQFISLSPFVTGENINYVFPVFRPVITHSPKNMVMRLGYCTNGCIDNETDRFIQNNIDYTFIYVVWGDRNYSNLTKHQNVRVFHDIDTKQLIELIQHSKFFLSRKVMNYDRYSSLLGMAISFEKPLIVDVKTADAYGLPGFLFNTDYSDIGKLNLIDDSRYNSVLNATREFKTKVIQNNHATVNKIFTANN